MQELLTQIIDSSVTDEVTTSLSKAIITLFLAMTLGIMVASVYKYVHKGISYSASYAYSIVIVTMVVAFVMMIIGSDVARAFTLLGAFTLIRYRTAVKDPKDTAFIFLALVIGLGVGAGEYVIASVGTVLIVSAALFLDKIDFGSLIKLEQVLYLTIDAKTIDQNNLETMLRGLFKEISLINVNYNSDSKVLQYSYNVKLSSKNSQAEAMKNISVVHGVKHAEILSSQQVVEF